MFSAFCLCKPWARHIRKTSSRNLWQIYFGPQSMYCKERSLCMDSVTFKIAVSKNKATDRIRCRRGSCSRGKGCNRKASKKLEWRIERMRRSHAPEREHCSWSLDSDSPRTPDATYDAVIAFSRCPSHKREVSANRALSEWWEGGGSYLLPTYSLESQGRWTKIEKVRREREWGAKLKQRYHCIRWDKWTWRIKTKKTNCNCTFELNCRLEWENQ